MKKLSPNATTYTAIGLIVFGLIFIFMSWNAAASPENGVDLRAQFPYLLSGGLGGLALVGAGLTLVRTFESRRDSKELLAQLERLTVAVERLEASQTARDLAQANAREQRPGLDMPPPAPPFEPAQ